jgi:hypothetical protein
MFQRLRNDSADAAGERSELIVLLVFAAGVAAALAWGGDRVRELDTLDSLIWVFATGIALGFVIYWVVGGALSFVVHRLGGVGSSRRARHVLAFSFAPLALAPIAWLFDSLLLMPLVAASVVLLVVGLSEVYGWSTRLAAEAVVLAAAWLGALGVSLLSVLALLRRLGE